jgi:DEAD/DEAH box helicase domain-containing protein
MLLVECIQHGLRTIAFCKTRKLCELVTAYTRETLKATSPHLIDTISVYRAGYSAQDRRGIEHALFSGKLRAVAATNALELGVDVGDLDCTLHLGFPGSVASLWQQSGRSGRRGQPSLAIYIAFDGKK